MESESKVLDRRNLLRLTTGALAGATALELLTAERAESQDMGEIMKTRLYRVILPVDDIDRADRFYTKLLGLTGERVSPGRHYFDCGGTILACYDPVADGDGKGDGWHHHFNQYLYFAVDELEAVFERAKRLGCRLDKGIAEMPWGERLFYTRDPFDNPICLVEDRTLFTGN